MTVAFSTGPTDSNSFPRSADVVEKAKLPTNKRLDITAMKKRKNYKNES